VTIGGTAIMGARSRERGRLLLVLLAALALRVGYLAAITPGPEPRADALWYLRQGWAIRHGVSTGPLTTVGPLYPLLLAGGWLLVPGSAEPMTGLAVPSRYLLIVRLVQVAMSVLTVALGYALGRRLGGGHRAAMVTALALALGPVFIMEPTNLATETLFICVLALGISMYLRAWRTREITTMVASGLVLAAASMTRPVLLAFPALLALHLGLVHGIRRGTPAVAALLAAYLLALAPWVIYLYRETGHPIPAGADANLWIGAIPNAGEWLGSGRLDAMRTQFAGSSDDYVGEVLRIIRRDPTGWATQRARRLVEALAKPHGAYAVAAWPLLVAWGRQDRSVWGLWAMLAAPGMASKIVVYVWHYAALALALVGVSRCRARWRDALVIVAVIGYFLTVHAVLFVIPRYLFPAELFFWVLAGQAVAQDRGGAPAAAAAR
jgi:Dolichyl-phosphate-mannose-protein mannosyltransferase